MLKGFEEVELGFLVIIGSVIFAIILVLTAFAILQIKAGISAKVNILVDTTSKGSALVSILNAESMGTRNSEIIGSLGAVNKGESIEGIEGMLRKLDLNMRVRSLDNSFDEKLNEKDNAAGSWLNAEIALPGGRKGVIGIA